VNVTVNATKACEEFGGVTIPPYQGGSGACAVDDRAFNATLSPVGVGTRNRKVEISFNKLYPGDYLVITINVKVHSTYDNGTFIPEDHDFVNTGSITAYDYPSDYPTRKSYTYNSNPSEFTYQKGLSLEPNRSSQITPGSWVTYEHTVSSTLSEDTVVCFSVASTQGWSWIITDASGNPITSLPLAAGDSEKIYIKYFVPSGTPDGTTDETIITLHEWNGSSCNTSVAYDDAVDTTVVNTTRLRLEKSLRKCDAEDIDDCDAQFSTDNTAYPNEYLEYHIAFKNLSVQSYHGLVIADVIPEHTVFVEDAYGAGQDVLVHLPDGSEIYKNVTISGGTVQVDLTSDIPLLNPGNEGWIQYKVRIQGD
jgi:uncharacterized repeat protein (TIGR01451 family)